MSILGSNLASSVAPVLQQAQQVARQKQREAGNPQTEIRRVQEAFETHLQALGEDDQFESPTHLHVDDHLPEQERQGRRGKREENQPTDAAEAKLEDARQQGADVAEGGRSHPDGVLYRHIDATA